MWHPACDMWYKTHDTWFFFFFFLLFSGIFCPFVSISVRFCHFFFVSFCPFGNFFWYQCYYRHKLRDSGIFFVLSRGEVDVFFSPKTFCNSPCIDLDFLFSMVVFPYISSGLFLSSLLVSWHQPPNPLPLPSCGKHLVSCFLAYDLYTRSLSALYLTPSLSPHQLTQCPICRPPLCPPPYLSTSLLLPVIPHLPSLPPSQQTF